MAKYEGVTGPNLDWQVFKDGVLLSPQRSLQIRNHSPDGFSWGYGGSGPHQLALALLLEEGLDPDDALALEHGFCGRFVARLDMGKGWTVTSEELSGKMWEHGDLSRSDRTPD